MKRLTSALVLFGLLMAYPRVTSAGSITFTGTSGSLAASVTFSDTLNSGYLTVVLTNTSASDVLVPADVLTAVFFDWAGVTLTPYSALLSGGSSVLFASQPAGGNVGGEWAYGSGLSGAPNSATNGISSAGFNLFGSYNFNGPDLDPPGAVNGLNYGITSLGDNSTTGNAAVTGGTPLIRNQVTFLLTGLPSTYSLSSIRNVYFQYGTDLAEPSFPGCSTPGPCSPTPVPEPASLLLLGSGLVIGAVVIRRRQNSGAR